MTYTKKELEWIQNFIDTRFDGVDASDEMIGLMEKSGLLKTEETAKIFVIKNHREAAKIEAIRKEEELTSTEESFNLS